MSDAQNGISKKGKHAVHRFLNGFSLIELMVAVAIISILAAFALPSYRENIRESRRTTAKTALLDLATQEEKYFAANNVYAPLTSLGYASVVNNAISIPSTSETYYTLQVTLNASATSFTATATPAGNQAQDTCGTFQINDQGTQTVSGSGTKCW